MQSLASTQAAFESGCNPTMSVQVWISRFQCPRVVRGAMTMCGPSIPRNCAWKASVAMDCAVLPRPCNHHGVQSRAC